jgi:hypothetical protein
MDLSNSKCQTGLRVAKAAHKLEKQVERPCDFVGLVDKLEVEMRPDRYTVRFVEGPQERERTCFMN